MKVRNLYGPLFGSVAVSALLFGGSAAAQQAAPSNSTAVSEVIVTANKKAERIQDVAMSVTAVSGVDLAQSQALDLQDISTKIAGLNLEQGGFAGSTTRVILRGLNTGSSGATVASVVDDIPLTFSGSLNQGAFFAADFDPYDLNQIEVLRGPQGSLYGATAEGGLIKYITNAPNLHAYHVGVEAGVLDLDHGGVGESGKAYVNIPLLDGTAAIRASGYYESSPGWISDALAGASHTNDFKRYGGRVSLLWKPTQDLSIRATVMEQRKDASNYDTLQVNGMASPSDPFGLTHGYNFNTYLLQPNSSRASLYALNVDYDFHWAKIQSITSYGKLTNTFATDNPYYGNLFAPQTTLTQFGIYGISKFNQEFRLSSEPDSKIFGHPLEWQAGVFYTNEPSEALSHYVTRSYPSGQAVDTPFFSPTTPEVLYADLPSDYNEIAGYADLTYHFTPQFDIEAGGRVFKDNQHAQQTQGGAFLGTPIASEPIIRSSESSGTYSVAARYHLEPDTLVYVRIASGYRPGGPETYIPGGPAGLPTQFGPDSTVNYEVGMKGFLLDKTLSVDVDAFDIEWSKVQVSVVIPIGGVAYGETDNVGSARSQGFEWNIDWSPLHGLHLSTVGAYTDAKLTARAGWD